ncbi:MAG TPA: NHL repeat-containing protein [Edaphobacter sp.]
MPIPRQWPRSIVSTAIAAALAIGLAGCGVSTSSLTSSTSVAGEAYGGQIFGGNQPISNAVIQMYAPGTNGYGSSAAPLLNRQVTTDATGHFSLANAFSCPSGSTPVYLVVTGGNPGLTSSTNNASLVMMGLLGNCGSLNSSSYFVINELTTVAAVWSLGPFMVDYAHIGTSSGNVQGLLNAFATAENLVSIETGSAPGHAPSIATVPRAEINTLGDILAGCVNSNGSTSSTAPCGRLFAASTPIGGTTPGDTVAAALDIARNPGHNVGSLYTTVPSNAPFQPTLVNAPSDWTLAIAYTSPAFKTPRDLAIDSQGNAWVLSSTGSNSSSVSILNIGGISATFPQSGANFGRIALDPYDDPWLTNPFASNIVELNSSGGRATLNPFSGAGIQGPGPLAFDGAGNVWIANGGPSVSKLSANGAVLSPGAGFNTNGVSSTALALDTSGNVWVADSANNKIEVLSQTGAAIPGSPYSGAGINGPFSIAIDSVGGAWVANRIGSSLSRLTSFGDTVAGSPYYGAGLNAPIDLAVDGLGNVWLANSGSNSVSEFLSTGRPQSGASGYGSAALSNPFRVALDRSGNLWVASLGTSVVGSGLITQIVGVAAPVVTPLSVAIQSNALNQRP